MDLSKVLQEYVSTANNPAYNGDYEVINSKFPELTGYDPEVLKQYVATANNPAYGGDYNAINSKFPEFEIQTQQPASSSSTAKPVDKNLGSLEGYTQNSSGNWMDASGEVVLWRDKTAKAGWGSTVTGGDSDKALALATQLEAQKALTVEDASPEDISSVSIDSDYWAKIEKDRGVTRDQVLEMMKDPTAHLDQDDLMKKIEDEQNLGKSISKSGDKADTKVDYSDPKANMPAVELSNYTAKRGLWSTGEDSDVGKVVTDLKNKYVRYGFDFSFDGINSVIVVADNGESKWFKIFGGSKDDGLMASMDEWMRDRTVDKYGELGVHLDKVEIKDKERDDFAKKAQNEYDNYLTELQLIEDAQASEGGFDASAIEGNLYSKLLHDAAGADYWQGQQEAERIRNLKPGNIEHDGEDAFVQARLSVAEEAFRDNLEGLSPEEKRTYKLTEEDIDTISKSAEGIDKNDEKVREIAIGILSKQKEEGLLQDRIYNSIGDYDQEVLEALGKEKLNKLSETQTNVIKESKSISEKFSAIVKVAEASGDDLKSYDAEGKIKAIQSREFKTQEEVDAAKSEIAAIVAQHEKLAKTHEGNVRNYELIRDAAIKTNDKINNLKVDIEDAGLYTELIGLDYSLVGLAGEKLANASIDVVQGAYGFLEMGSDLASELGHVLITDQTPFLNGMLKFYDATRLGSEASQKTHAAVDAWQAEWTDSVFQLSYDEINSASDMGRWFTGMIAGQVPNFALMATTGPASLYIMGMTSAGTKYLDLKGQNRLHAESGGLYGNEYSFGEMFLNASVSGTAEAVSELITFRQLGAAKGIFKGMIKNKGVRAGVAEYLTKNVFTSRALLATGTDFLEEGGSEAVATISSNLMDIWTGNKEAGFWDGVEESFVSGVMMSGALKSPTLANHAISAFRSPDTDAIRNDNLTRINELSESLLNKDHELSKEAVDVIETEIAELTAETIEMLEQDIKRVDILTSNDKKKLLGLEKGKNKILAQWESVKNDDALSETEKEAIKNRLTNKMVGIETTKAEMLQKPEYNKEAADIKYSETTMPLKSPDQQFEENIEFAKKHSALYGLEVNDEMSVEQIREKYGEEAASSDGFVDGNNIVINREVAAETGAVTVGSHELLHGILKKAMNVDTDLSTKVISQLKKEIGGQWSVVQQRIDDNYSPEYMEANPDEYLTLVSDAIGKGEIKYEETIFDKIRDTFNEMGLFKKAGFNKIKFKTGKDVYRFLREYNKSIHKGALSSKIVEATKGDAAKSSDITYSMSSDQKKAAAVNVKELGTNQTNKAWRRGGADAAIKDIKDNGYFDALIASKYKVKPVPRDFVEKVYSEITPHIKRFKPEQNDNLFAYINSQIGNKAGNVYNSEYKVDEAMRGSKDIDAKTSEGAPVIQVEADTDSGVTKFEEQDMSMAAQAKRTKLAEQGKSESDKYSGLRTELGLEKPMMDKVRQTVMKTFGTKLPDVNSKKFKAALQKAYRTELKKPIQDMIGKGAAYDTFLAESFPTVFKFLPKETLLQMERNIDPAKRIFTKSERITKPTEVDKLINDGLLPKETNRLSGPTLITKLPYPGSKKVMAYFRGQNMDNTLGYKVGASTLGTRKDKLAMEMGVELGFDATMETLKDPAVQERRQGILELQGVDQKKNETAIIGKQINRDPNIKFSFTAKKVAESSANGLLKDLGISNPVVFRKAPYIGAKGKEKFHKLVDWSREVEVKEAVLELGKHTRDVLTTFNDFAGGKYLSDIRTAMSGGQGISFFGLTSMFDSLTKGLQPGPKLFPRTKLAKDKTLDPDAVRKEDGKNVFGTKKNKLSEKEFVAKESKKLDELESFFTDLQAYLKDHSEHAWLFARMITDASSNTSSMTRVSAPVMAFPAYSNGNFIYGEIIVEEHSFPQNNVGTLLFHAAVTGASIKDVMKIIRGSYMQMGLLNSEAHPHDDMVTAAGYKTTMPDIFWDKIVPRLKDGSLKITNGLASMVRYAESGVNLNMYMVPGTGQTITEYFGVGKYDNASQTLVDKQNELITKFLTGEITKKEATSLINEFAKVEGVIESAAQANTSTYDQALANTYKFSKSGKAKGMSTFDFDETLIIDGENSIIATDPVTGQQIEIKSNEWPIKGPDLTAAGFEFDFSDFAQVRGGKEGPLLQKMKNQISKYGPKNVFVLTARQQDSAQPIHEWLKNQGINIPTENITGLGKSEGSAKGDWMLQKFAEGYNDMYFVDDALPNVKAVRDALDKLDIKSKVVQAKLKFSRSGSNRMSDILNEGELDLNKILEQTKGVGKNKVFSAAKARQRGKGKGRFKFFVPPSADDFAGLMYAFMGKGEQGNKHHAWFKENLFDPFSKGMRRHKIVQQQVASDMKNLRKAMPDVRKKLGKKVQGTEYTHEDAIRIYNWSQAGLDIPGLSAADQAALVKAVESDAQLQAFASGVNSISETTDGMVDPGNHWTGGNIALDLKEALDKSRRTHLQQWKDNVDIIFNEANMNKIEAVYGPNFREALEDSLWRMENGGTRSKGGGRIVNNFTNWIHGSIGTTMFLNARSAMLQMISNVNFVNWSDNNMVAAAKAFANQPQYWKDVSMIMNSPFLKQRRSGIQTDVNAAELLAQVKDSKNKLKAATAYLLQFGFTPTQIADSFAIATGGATMYRNRANTYVKQGMTQADAETKAFEDMMEIAEETQQSTREDKISQQQASPLGKFILAFQNTPMQYNRLIKKAAQDLVNGRGDPKANISRIVYYGGIQNLIFYGLQQALFAALFSDDEEDEITDKKKERVVNGMIDTILRGSGIAGVAVATVKNVVLKFMKESEKMDDGEFFTDPDWGNVVIEGLNISPPIGIKARKIYSGLKTWEYNKDVIDHMDKTDIDNPVYDAAASVTEAVTNLPLSRLYNKVQNISESLDAEHETWKRIAMLLGWSKWSFGIKNQDVVTAKSEVKEIKAEAAEAKRELKKQEKAAEKAAEEEAIIEGLLLDQEQEREDGQEDIKCAAVNKSGNRCGTVVKGGGNYCTIHESVPQVATEAQCSHVKDNGDRCKMKTKNQSGKCYYHD